MFKSLLAIVVPIFVLAAPALSQENVRSDWEFVFAPYLQVPAISGDASLGRIEGADVDVGMDDILDNLSIGAMLQVEAHHSSGFGLSLNYAFMKLEDSIRGPRDFTEFEGEVFQGLMEGYVNYRWRFEQNAVLDLYGGARWWDLDVDLSAENGLGEIDNDHGASWVDPVIGLRFIPKLADQWRLLIQGDIGGFDVSSDSSYNVMGGVLWDSSESFSVALLYRALWVDYGRGDPGQSDRFVYDTVTHGPLLGAVFRY